MSRSLTKAVIARALPQPLELLASSTDEEVHSCYPAIDVLHHAVLRGGEVESQDKLRLINDSVMPEPEPAELSPVSSAALVEAMLAGAFIGSVETVDQALRSGADITAAEISGRTILHYCCTGGHASLLSKVLKKLAKVCKEDAERYAAVLNKVDANGWSALAVAVCRSHTACASVLLEHSDTIDFEQRLEHACPPSLGFERSKSSLLHMAAIQAHAPLLTKLSEHIPRDQLDSQNRNIFHYLAATRNSDSGIAAISALLMTDCSELLIVKDSHGRTPLFCAAAYGNSEILLAFIRHMAQHKQLSLTEALLTDVDQWTMSALQVAFLKRHYSVIDKVGTAWAIYRSSSKDAPTFSAALRATYPGATAAADDAVANPHTLLRTMLENQEVWSNWLLADLNGSELTCYELIATLVRFGTVGNDRFAIIRAIRRGGVDLLYKTLTKCCQATQLSAMINAREFLQEIKTELFASQPPLEAQAAWKYVNAESLVAARAAANRRPGSGAEAAATRFYSHMRRPSPPKASTRMARAVVPASTKMTRQKSLPTSSTAASPARVTDWNENALPSFASPTSSVRRLLEQRNSTVQKYESQRLR